MNFHFVSLFPELFSPWLTTSVIGRAYQAGIFEFKTYQLRDFSEDRHARVDDQAYGGGGGMVLCLSPLVKAVESIRAAENAPCRVIYFSPQGERLTVSVVERVLQAPIKNLILICGHYEGVDARFVENWVDEEISLGDFVLTGGELPAIAFADALIRQCHGTLRTPHAMTESFSLRREGKPLLEYPQYTRPESFRGFSVPDVLLSGNHRAINEWRQLEALSRTRRRRPDLLKIDTDQGTTDNLRE